jgi:hypothetical protein
MQLSAILSCLKEYANEVSAWILMTAKNQLKLMNDKYLEYIKELIKTRDSEFE